MISALEQLAGPSGPLSTEPPDAAEIAGLECSVNKRIVIDLIAACEAVADKLQGLNKK